MKMTLYEIGGEMQAFEDFLEQIDGDVSDPAFETMVDEWLATNEKLLADKLDNYGMVIKNRLALAEAQKAEATRLLEAKVVNENFVNKMKERLRDFFKLKDLKKVEGTLFKFRLQNNSQRKMTIDLIYDGEEGAQKLPSIYQKITTVPDTTKISNDLKEMEALLNKRERLIEERQPEEFTAMELERLSELEARLTEVAWFEPVGQHIRIV